jgi:hypothetical protein
MNHRPSLPATLVVAAIISGAVLVAVPSHLTADPVYTVAGIQAGLRHAPDQWLGRTLLVRGTVAPLTLPCTSIACSQALEDNQPVATDPPLPLTAPSPDRLLDAARALPFAGHLMPARQQVHWDGPAVYRVRLQEAPAALCGYAPCRVAILLDAAPFGPNDWVTSRSLTAP